MARSEGATRTLRLLTSFTRERHTQTAKELAISADIPLPSVYRYLTALKDMDLLLDDERGGYHLSSRFKALAQAADAADDLVAIADPPMRALASKTGEAVLLVRLVNGASVAVHGVEAAHPLRVSVEMGARLPSTDGAVAQLMLASLAPDRLQANVDALSPEGGARSDALVESVERARERGWSVSHDEVGPGTWSAAAAVQMHGQLAAVVAITVPTLRATEAAQEQCLRGVRSAAAEIASARGCRGTA